MANLSVDQVLKTAHLCPLMIIDEEEIGPLGQLLKKK